MFKIANGQLIIPVMHQRVSLLLKTNGKKKKKLNVFFMF